jgi:hypothetical protein
MLNMLTYLIFFYTAHCQINITYSLHYTFFVESLKGLFSVELELKILKHPVS